MAVMIVQGCRRGPPMSYTMNITITSTSRIPSTACQADYNAMECRNAKYDYQLNMTSKVLINIFDKGISPCNATTNNLYIIQIIGMILSSKTFSSQREGCPYHLALDGRAAAPRPPAPPPPRPQRDSASSQRAARGPVGPTGPWVLNDVCVFLPRPDHLNGHIRQVHTTERPHKCQVRTPDSNESPRRRAASTLSRLDAEPPRHRAASALSRLDAEPPRR